MGRGASIEAATRWRTGRSGRPLSVVRRLGVAALAALTSCSVVALVAPAAHADIRFGLEQVDIRNVEVGGPVMSTTSNCEGFVRHDSPVIPVTIEASFIPPPGGQPIGPYAVANWSGGFGGVDDHFGRGQAHEFVQFFHILLTVDSLQYHGPGVYSLDVIVQDVGLASGYDEHDEIPVHIGGLPPSTAHANVKCATVGDGLAGLKDAAGSEVVSLGKEIFKTLGCLTCNLFLKVRSQVTYYDKVLHALALDLAADDPPDNDYQQIASPDPPPPLSPPSGLSSAQQTALSAFAAGTTQAIGLTRALYTTEDRIWGADNAADQYWYDRQMLAFSALGHPGRSRVCRAALAEREPRGIGGRRRT